MTGSSKWIRAEKRAAIYARDNWTCQYCGRDVRSCDAGQRTLDHLVITDYGTEHQGSTNFSWNLVTACAQCNTERGNMEWRAFAMVKGGKAAIRRILTQVGLPLPGIWARDMSKEGTHYTGPTKGQTFRRP